MIYQPHMYFMVQWTLAKHTNTLKQHSKCSSQFGIVMLYDFHRLRVDMNHTTIITRYKFMPTD